LPPFHFQSVIEAQIVNHWASIDMVSGNPAYMTSIALEPSVQNNLKMLPKL
jgi:hypothetical protein